MAYNNITKTAKFNLNTVARDQIDVNFVDWYDLDMGTRSDSNAQILDAELYKLLKRGLFVGYTTMPTTNNYRIENSSITEMFDKIVLLLIPNTDNTGTTTLQINNFISSPLKKVSNNAYIDVVAGDLNSKQPTLVYYDLTANVFVLASALVQSASTTQSGIVQLSNETNSTDETKAVTPHALKIVADSKLDTNQKGVANGVASLDTEGKVSLTQMPSSILGSLKYIGTWDASGGTTPSNPSNGNYWVISVAGVIDTVEYNLKDWLIYNASTWSKLDGEDNIDFATQTDAETGTNTTKVMSPLRVFQSITKWISDTTVSALTTTAKTIVGAINENADKIGILSTKIDNGITLTPTANLGMNSVIRKTDNVTSIPKFTIKGKSYVNLLGKDGNCEDISKWTSYQVTPTLDSLNRVFGSNGFKLTLTSTTGNLYKQLSSIGAVDVSKYYLMSAYIKNGNATKAYMKKDNSGGGIALYGSTITSTSVFTRTAIKCQPSDLNVGNYFQFYVEGSTGQYGYVDGIMLNEITADEYNNLTTDQLMEKYPYVDSYACLENPYIEVKHDNLVRNGNGEEGIGWWTSLSTNGSISIENGKFKLTSTSEALAYTQIVKVKPNTNYYIKRNITDGTTTGAFYITDVANSTVLKPTLEGSFNTGNYNQVLLQMYINGTGTGYFDHIHIIEGTTPPTEYKSQRIERTVIEGKFTSDDSFTYENGEVSGLLNWKHKTLYGKDYDWKPSSDGTGWKMVTALIPPPNNVNSNVYTKVVKYDGSITLGVGNLTGANQNSLYNNTVYLGLADTDTGWAETIAPNSDEVKAFMNGWKAIWNNGTRYTAWTSILDNSMPSGATNTTTSASASSGQKIMNITTQIFSAGDMAIYRKCDGYWEANTVTSVSGTQVTFATNIAVNINSGASIWKADNGTTSTPLLTYCKNNIAPNYIGYQLHYKLQNPEPITDVNTHIHGDIVKFDNGDNYLYLDYGIVLGEMANPALYSTTYYQINAIGLPSTVDSILRYKAEDIQNIYKNGIYDVWRRWDSYAYGKYRADKAVAEFDTNATYTTDYIILRTLHTSPTSITMSYNQDIISSISDLVEITENKQNCDTSLNDYVVKSKYEDKTSTFSTWRTVSTNTGYIDVIFPFIANKKTIPRITVKSNFFTINGIADTTFILDSVSVKEDMSVLTFKTNNTTTVSNIKSYGVDASVRAVFDCNNAI